MKRGALVIFGCMLGVAIALVGLEGWFVGGITYPGESNSDAADPEGYILFWTGIGAFLVGGATTAFTGCRPATWAA